MSEPILPVVPDTKPQPAQQRPPLPQTITAGQKQRPTAPPVPARIPVVAPIIFTIKFKNGHTQQFSAPKDTYEEFVKSLTEEGKGYKAIGMALINLGDISCILPK